MSIYGYHYILETGIDVLADRVKIDCYYILFNE